MPIDKADLEKKYREISSLYDHVEELAETVESQFTTDPEVQLSLVEPVINHVADAADILAEEFISVLETPSRATLAKRKVENALRKIFMALEDYRKQLGLRTQNALTGISNIADPVIEKIRKQSERIVIIFMQMMEISLDRIMHKSEIEEFRRANERDIGNGPSVGH